MQFKARIFTFLWFLIFAFSFSTQGKEQVFQSNLDHSRLGFKIRFLELSEVEGSFEQFKSRFTFDPATNTLSQLRVEIQSASITTGNKKRDLHLRRHDFFNVKKFPQIIFESQQKILLNETREVLGKLTILGQSYPAKIFVNYLGSRKDTWEKENFFFDFSSVLNRKELGLNWNKTLNAGGFVLGDEVKIMGQVQAQLLGQKTVFSRFQIPDSKTMRIREQVGRGEIAPLVTKVTKATEPAKKDRHEDFAALRPVQAEQARVQEFMPKNLKAEQKNAGPSPSMDVISQLTGWQFLGYLIVGFYGFIGAIALALAIQYFMKKEKITESNYKKFLRESLTDSFSILIIVPYALAMWTYLFH